MTTEEGGGTILDETRLAFAETGDVGGNEILGAHAFPRFSGSGCCEGTLALNASGERLLLSAHRWGWRTSGHGSRGEIEKLMGGHAELLPVGGTVWGEARLELHGGRVWDGGGEGRCREGVIRVGIGEEGVLGGRPGSGLGDGGGEDVGGNEVGELGHFKGECTIYVRVKRKENTPTVGRAEEMVVVENQEDI